MAKPLRPVDSRLESGKLYESAIETLKNMPLSGMTGEFLQFDSVVFSLKDSCDPKGSWRIFRY